MFRSLDVRVLWPLQALQAHGENSALHQPQVRTSQSETASKRTSIDEILAVHRPVWKLQKLAKALLVVHIKLDPIEILVRARRAASIKQHTV